METDQEGLHRAHYGHLQAGRDLLEGAEDEGPLVQAGIRDPEALLFVIWFAVIGLVFGGWWVLSARRWFKGPVRMSEEEVAARERQYEQPAAGAAPAG